MTANHRFPVKRSSKTIWKDYYHTRPSLSRKGGPPGPAEKAVAEVLDMYKKRDDFENWQDRIFQEIKDLEDIGIQKEGENATIVSFWERLAITYGLSLEELVALYRPGMNGARFLVCCPGNTLA